MDQESGYVAPADTDIVLASGIFFFLFIAVIIAYVVTSFLLGRIFKKAGVEQWKAWVPIYNNWKFLEIGGQQGFWAVLAVIPVINLISAVFMIIAAYYIGLKLGKQGAFVVLYIFLPLVWLIWLAVDDSKWEQAQPTTDATDQVVNNNPPAFQPAQPSNSDSQTPPTQPLV